MIDPGGGCEPGTQSGLMANAAPDQLEAVVAVEDVAADPRGLELHDRVPAHGHNVRLAFPGAAHHDDRPRLEIAPDLRDRKIRFLVGPHGSPGSSLSRVIGKSRTRTPVALNTALATALPVPQTPSSPTPLMPR